VIARPRREEGSHDIRGVEAMAEPGRREGPGAGFEFLERADLAALPLGSTPLTAIGLCAGDEIHVSEPSAGKFEAHEDYIDIQYLVSGEEMIGLAPVEALKITSPTMLRRISSLTPCRRPTRNWRYSPALRRVLPRRGAPADVPLARPARAAQGRREGEVDYWKTRQRDGVGRRAGAPRPDAPAVLRTDVSPLAPTRNCSNRCGGRPG